MMSESSVLTGKAFTSFSVRNIEQTRKFYGGPLGLDLAEDTGMPGLLRLHLADGPSVVLYEKPDHSPASFTVLNFIVHDIERAVDDLTGRGVHFEQYNTRELKTDAKGIFRGRGPTIAWFRDPSGNILSLIEQK
jgi:catechol 2,3-dioxygenase-like lactoylglutathione lyase family enzyme